MSEVVIGVDGGGSRTRAVVADETGRELGRAEGPGSRAHPSRPEVAAGVVAEVARTAARQAGIELPVAVLFAGMSGTGRETTRAGVEQVLQRLGVARSVRVESDARASFHHAFGEGPGILVMSGTGSMALGRGPDGLEARVGGWGSLLGDEGSGYGVGIESLRRIARGADGRGPETGLEGAVLEALGLEGVRDLILWSEDATKAEIAALTPVVAQLAREGDAVAGEILVKAVEELEGHVLTILANLGPWPTPPGVALQGGLLYPGGPLRRATENVLARHAVRRLDRDPDPLEGAVGLARAMLG